MHALYVRQTIVARNTSPTSTRLWETSTEEAPGAGKHGHINHNVEFRGAGMFCFDMSRMMPKHNTFQFGTGRLSHPFRNVA